MEFEILWWYWLAFGLALLATDLLLVNTFYVMWLGIGAALVGIMMLVTGGMPLTGQVTLWGVFSVAMIAVWIVFRKKFEKVRRPEAMIGITGVIMDWSQGSGSIRFQRPYGGTDIWKARSDEAMAKGDVAKVSAVDIEEKTVTLGKSSQAQGSSAEANNGS